MFVEPIIDRDGSWVRFAVCAQTDSRIFLLGKGVNAGPAKRICAVCDVRSDCLASAMLAERGKERSDRAGVWGGLTPQERYDLDQGGRVLSTSA